MATALTNNVRHRGGSSANQSAN